MTDQLMINLLSDVEPWFDPNLAGGILGGGGGGGVLGAVYGSLVGVLAPRGKGRYRQAEHRRLQAEEFRRG